MTSDLDAPLEMHDELIARRGIDVWIGAEPTFTRAESIEPAWIGAAEGDDKLARAYAIAMAIADEHPGATVTRVVGRQFPGEPLPRFAYGVRWRDDVIGSAKGARAAMDAAPEPAPTELGGDHWLTVTPDPGVVEINTAPCETTSALYVQAQHIWAAAAKAGLSPSRYRFNGDLGDSGGGGQITLGGSRPDTSPFLRYPHVLPALVRYVNNHPSLSYWFASECVGSASQGPRPDEGARERWDELGVSLDWLESIADRGELAPEQLQQTLAPLLVDSAGNSHRAELNVEKLWSPHIAAHGPRHGRMGVVEFRAVRMPERPGMLVALAALLRSIVARLVVSDYREDLIDWHDELHDWFALPAALHRDLRFVLGDLDEHGLGLPVELRRELESWRVPGITCRLGDAQLTVRPALEFWPLVGDVASQEHASARWVDASTQRWEISLDGPGPDRLLVGGKWVRLRSLGSALPPGVLRGPAKPDLAIGHAVRAIGVRRRVYQPSPGLHPGLPVVDPLVIEWTWQGRSQRVELWAWKPDGGPYAGLPHDEHDALARRQERIRVTAVDGEPTGHSFWRESRLFTIDLRRDK